jgi:hypothetical protein
MSSRFKTRCTPYRSRVIFQGVGHIVGIGAGRQGDDQFVVAVTVAQKGAHQVFRQEQHPIGIVIGKDGLFVFHEVHKFRVAGHTDDFQAYFPPVDVGGDSVTNGCFGHWQIVL